jgi:hypothetical protein
LSGIQGWQAPPAKSIEKNTIVFLKVVEDSKITTLVFKVLGNFIQNFGVNCIQTEDQQNRTLAGRALRRDVTSQRRARASASAPCTA